MNHLAKRSPLSYMVFEEIPKKRPRFPRFPRMSCRKTYKSIPIVKMSKKIEHGLKPSPWLRHLKMFLRQVISKSIANGAVGNQWDFSAFNNLGNSTSIEDTTVKQDIMKTLKNIVAIEGDDESAIIEHILKWTPTGTVVHRAEYDLHSDFSDIAKSLKIPQTSGGLATNTADSGMVSDTTPDSPVVDVAPLPSGTITDGATPQTDKADEVVYLLSPLLSVLFNDTQRDLNATDTY